MRWVWGCACRGESLESLVSLGEEEAARWEERKERLVGEKATVAVILGGEVGWMKKFNIVSTLNLHIQDGK